MGTDEAASPQRSTNAELEAAKRALAACQSEVCTLLARQAASTDVLKTISASPDDPQPVFEMIARRASELCKADASAVLEYDGALVHLRALGGLESTTRAAYARMFPMALTREMSFGSAIIDGEAVHITDYSRHIAQNITNPALRAAVQQINPTVVLGVPLLREGRAIGAVNLARFADGKAFDDAEITLVESFAEQAVIAITSAQTRRALAARNNEYGERIEQQSATIDVLRAMATLASDTRPVFELITARARDLCGSLASMLFEFDGELLHLRAWGGYDPAAAQDYLQQFPMRPDRGTAVGRVILDREIVHIRNIADDPEIAQPVRSMGVRSTLGIPLLRNGQPIGVIAIGSTTTGGFSDSQVELLKTFAEQAVIAIGGAETFRELQQRTAELAARNSAYGEKIEHQSATIDVLKAMSSSPGDAQPVFDQIVHRARELCEANAAGIFEFDGRLLHFKTASHDPAAPAEYHASAVAHLAEYPMVPRKDTAAGRAIIEREIVNLRVADDANLHASVRSMGITYIVVLPLLRDGKPVGTIALNTRKPTGFSESQVALLKTFAEQAVIAIRSAETFRELQQRTRDLSESLEQQTATADVLEIINTSPGDIVPVFNTILERAHSVCGADGGALYTFDGLHVRWVAVHGYPADYAKSMLSRPPAPANPYIERMAETKRILEVPDIWADPSKLDENFLRDIEASGMRSGAAIPLVKDGTLVGCITAWRRQVGSFSAKQIALLENFAAQAVIAMENARLLGELRESLEQQTAMADVMRCINASPGDATPVFDVILEKAHAVCGATIGSLSIFDGEFSRKLARHGYPPEMEAFHSRPYSPYQVHEPLFRGETIHIPDVLAHPDLIAAGAGDALRAGGMRSWVEVPLWKDGKLLGSISGFRTEPRPFSDKDLRLLENFAAQAVIAMENARLLTELRESLDQQTATAEVLQVINANPGNLQPVFEIILQKAHNLCGADIGALHIYDGTHQHAVATHGYSAEVEARVRHPHEPHHYSRRLINGERHVHVPDMLAIDPSSDGGASRITADAFNARTALGIGLRKEDTCLGFINAIRHQLRPFSDKEIALLESFAAQAVIAMENARLLGELRESLEQQTATAEVLKVISRSAFDLQPVLDTLIESAVRLCNASQGVIYLRDGDVFRPHAYTGAAAKLLEFLKRHPIRPGRETTVGRVAMTGSAHNIADMAAHPDFNFPGLVEHGTFRSLLGVPLLREGRAEGVLILNRQETLPFTPRQIELVTTFADQAVIAIENARLFDAVQKRTQELAQSVAELQALEEVLRAVNSSLELETVLSTIISRAVPLAQADEGMIYEFDSAEEVFVPKAAFGMADAQIGRLRERRIRMGETYLGRSALERAPIHVADVQRDESTPEAREYLPGIHALLAVPLLQGEKVIGGLVIRRRSEGAFAANTVTLMQTFAGQSVLAIENARLFQEAERARAAAEAALNDLRRAQDRLIQSEKMASLGQLTAGIAHEIKNPLNFVNNFSALSTELIDELRGVLANAAVDGPTRAEVEELGTMIKGNLEKVVQHGKRADGIVRNMLLHARESGGERRSVDLNATVDEALNLAYHGARAEKPGFTITLERNFDPAVGSVELYPQEFTRVMLNLFSNGFYAATRKAQAGAGAGFQPMLAVTTEARTSAVLIRARDNGTGIPDNARARLFEPFFTTKPAGEGTGLGLSISHDIIVKQHSGSIAVDSRVGECTEFTISLPRTSAGAPV
jgi:GAF domain-containing protein